MCGVSCRDLNDQCSSIKIHLINEIYSKSFNRILFINLTKFCYLFADNELYSGTVADFSGSDPIIYREPLQTEQYDSLSLNGELIPIYVFLVPFHFREIG